MNTSPCEHTRCGGCALLQLTAAEQLTRKREHVHGALLQHTDLPHLDVPEVLPADPAFGYRTRAKLVVSERGEIGLYARGGHDVVDIPECRVLSPLLFAVTAALRALLAQLPTPLSGLDLREVQGKSPGVLVTLLGDARDERELHAFALRAQHVEGVLGVAIGAREARSPQLLGAAPVPVAGQSIVRDALTDDLYYYATFGAFVQAHRGQARTIIELIHRELLGALGTLSSRRVLELYAGSGALALSLAHRGAQVLLCERYEPALSLVVRAAEEQHVRGVAMRIGDAETVLGDLVADGSHFDAVIVNPPRRGLSAQVRAGIVRLAPKMVVYVSCEPQTLARDLADFARSGLQVQRLAPLDMMPQSDDVESVVALVPGAPTPLRVLYDEHGLVAVDKPPHLPTIPQGEYGSSLLERLRDQLGVQELFAVHRLDEGTSGVCLFARKSEQVAPLSAALAAGQKRYTALVRGITNAKGLVKTPLRDGAQSREAVTRYTRKRVLSGHALLHVRPEQGRKHQVRRHLASIGHPLVGDARYGAEGTNRHFEHKFGLDRAFLHLSRVELQMPGGAEPLVLEAPLAGDLAAVLASLAPSS